MTARAGVDDLISELFPHHSMATAAQAKASESDWDSPVRQQPAAAAQPTSRVEDRGGSGGASDGLAAPPSSSTSQQQQQVRRSHFDDSDDEHDGAAACGSGGPPPRASPVPVGAAAQHTVPFPSFASSLELRGPCHDSCKLTNVGSSMVPHPTLEDLHSLDRSVTHQTARHLVMCRKGAFHVVAPKVGCGAADPPGCAFLGCKMCDHPVIRLQGARWEDHDGASDLYLVLRNYYPDWQRLATACPTAHREGGEMPSTSTALVPDTRAAAYCCQCSWYTVRSEEELLSTTPIDVACANAAGTRSDGLPRYLTSAQASQQAAAEGGSRRPPLWACKGHTM